MGDELPAGGAGSRLIRPRSSSEIETAILADARVAVSVWAESVAIAPELGCRVELPSWPGRSRPYPYDLSAECLLKLPVQIFLMWHVGSVHTCHATLIQPPHVKLGLAGAMKTTVAPTIYSL